MRISSQFESGNIEVVSDASPDDLRLNIRKDNGSDFYQWFHFRLSGAAGRPVRLIIENAGGAAYLGGWTDYQARLSVDRETWIQVPTRYEDGALVIETTPEADAVWIAYFAPYSLARHDALIAACQQSERARLDVIGQTLDGRDIDRLTIGEPGEGKKTIWVTARQHPGETMAEWCAEGFLERLLDVDDAAARDLLNRAVIHVIPNMNPDGSARGHLRTNAKGINLNREWDKPSADNSPEVKAVLDEMAKTGVDLFLDMHGDEALPYNFIAGAEGVPGWNETDQAQLDGYKNALAAINPDFQTEHGYPVTPAGRADLSIATNWMRHHFKCLAMTLEMPFKDSAITPNRDEGWSPERSIALGRSQIDAMRAVLDQI